MFMRRVILILSVLLLVTGASCQRPTSFFGGGESASEEEGTFVGTQGLEISFLEGAPPREVYQDTSFDILIELHNRGALDISEGTMRLGIPAIFQVEDKTKSIESIMGKEDYPGGEVSIMEDWTGVDVKQTTVRRDIGQSINAQVCYKGGIEAQPIVCVRPRPGSAGIIEGECGVEKKTISGGQGGPIAVTSITETVLKEDEDNNRIVFRIEVQDVGGGDVIDMDKVSECKLGERDKTKATVDVEKVSWLGGEEDFDCEGGKEEENIVLMLNGKGVFKCTSQAIPNDDHYSLPLYIKMNYGYVKSINKVFTLKKDVFYT